MREEKHLPSVVDGQLLRTSVSQIKKFDDTLDSGCNRRWYFDKVLHISEPQTKNQELGIQIHAQIEHYLKTGEDVLGPLAREAKRFLPEPMHESLLVEKSFDGMGFSVAGVPLVGYMDMVNGTPVWLDNEGVPHTLEEDCIEIGDHKSTSNLDYAKNPTELRNDTQMVVYGVAGAIIRPKLDSVRLSHNYICTRKKGAKKITVEVPMKEIEKSFERVGTVVEQMKAAAGLPSVEDLKPNLKACNSFNKPCPYMDKCQKDPMQQLLILTDLRSENKNATTSAGDKNVSLMSKLKTSASVVAPPPPPAPEPVIGAPEKAPADAVLDRAGEEGQMHMGADNQLYVWKEDQWRFAGAEAKKKWQAMQLKPGEYDHSAKQEDSAEAEQEKKRVGRPPGAKNKRTLAAEAKAAPPAATEAKVVVASNAPVAQVVQQNYLHTYYRCVPSVPTMPAEPYILTICDAIVQAANRSDPKDKTLDIRSSKNEMLAFGAWKGALERAIKASPPNPGAYRILGGGELYEVAAEAMGQLSSLYVRGVV